MWQKVKAWCLEQVLWAEQTMPGKSGAEKRKAVVDRLDELIRLPFYWEWLDGMALGWVVDWVCEKLNWLTDYEFNAETAAALAENSTEVIAALNMTAPEAAATEGKSLDERLAEICTEYGIKIATTSTPSTEVDAEVSAEVEPDDFNRCISFTLQYEGGANFTVQNGKPVLKASAKNDAGGATIYGITHTTLKAACAQGIVGHNDITKLTLDDAKKIYRKNYWDRYGWGSLRWSVNLCCFDCTVNHGIGGAAKILQRALVDRGHSVTIDGKFGPETFNALKAACANPTALAAAIITRRREYFHSIVAKKPNQKVFLKGWLNRCDALEKEVKANAST